MQTRSVFENISPLDHRYSISEKDVYDKLARCISEEAAVRSCAKAEAALVKAHFEVRGALTREIERAIDAAANAVDPEEVYAEEEKTQHNIRALVNVMKRTVPSEIAPFVHLGATSVDILDTALALRMRDVMQNSAISRCAMPKRRKSGVRTVSMPFRLPSVGQLQNSFRGSENRLLKSKSLQSS